MEAEGFIVYPAEWWHFDYQNWKQFRIQEGADILTLKIPGVETTNTIVLDTGAEEGISLAPEKWRGLNQFRVPR